MQAIKQKKSQGFIALGLFFFWLFFSVIILSSTLKQTAITVCLSFIDNCSLITALE
ncbi:secreted protein [Candidatus Thiomargarita nelsonii]|uniref:Secreted protein n=1 Tax=Candidatus Thiomargarita nelsonii TaxID=1003181 RepID=A0A176RXN8_9GAMM|nr:secreted protein [Candidatus Thiomargarita nelsonii]